MPTHPTTLADRNQLPVLQQVVSVMWPSFLTASLATVLFFVVFDPVTLSLVAGGPELTRLGGYTIGFFAFWLLTSTSSALTCYFRRPTPPRKTPATKSDAEPWN